MSRFHKKVEYERETRNHRSFHWVDYQWDYEKGSFDKWRVSEERAIREIAESILSDPGKRYFVYKHNKLQSFSDDTLDNTLEVNITVFRDSKRL